MKYLFLPPVDDVEIGTFAQVSETLHDMTYRPVNSCGSRMGTPTSSVTTSRSDGQSDAGLDLGSKRSAHPKKEKCNKSTKVRNFTKDEDFFLSKAYVRVSLDPIRGNDQKSQDFWSQVYKTFMLLYKTEAEVQEEDMTGRNTESIKSRFQRNIQKDVMEYCACCRTNEIRSGETSDDFFARMDRLFEEKKGKPFRFRHCMNVLREMPKFDCETKESGNIDKVVDDFLDVCGVENKEVTPEKAKDGVGKASFSNQATGKIRPQGTKAAKRQVVENSIDNKIEEKKVRILEDVAAGLNDMAAAIQRKQEREHLHSMLMIYQTMGNHEKVKEYLQLLELLPRMMHKGEPPSVATNMAPPPRKHHQDVSEELPNANDGSNNEDDSTQSQILVVDLDSQVPESPNIDATEILNGTELLNTQTQEEINKRMNSA